MFRRTVIAIAASATFGGVVGGLAVAATQSQASGAQRVQDARAESTLSRIQRKIDDIDYQLANGNSSLGFTLRDMKQDLYYICRDTEGSHFATCQGGP